jgi:hypothetical protein
MISIMLAKLPFPETAFLAQCSMLKKITSGCAASYVISEGACVHGGSLPTVTITRLPGHVLRLKRPSFAFGHAGSELKCNV